MGGLVLRRFLGLQAVVFLGVTEAACLAHSRRKFFDPYASNKSQIAARALHSISQLYDVMREVKDLAANDRLKIRQSRSRSRSTPQADALHLWLGLQRRQNTDGSAITKALDYCLKRWGELTRFLVNRQMPIANYWAQNQIRPSNWAKNWFIRLFPADQPSCGCCPELNSK